jgi:hypothetical protein
MKEEFNSKSSKTESYVHFLMIESPDGGVPILQRVKDRDIDKLNIPKGVRLFRFFDRLTTIRDGKKYTSAPTNVSKTYVIAEKLMIIDEVVRTNPTGANPNAGAEERGYDVVRLFGNVFQRVDEHAIVITQDKTVIHRSSKTPDQKHSPRT